jgi:hypothetical protein
MIMMLYFISRRKQIFYYKVSTCNEYCDVKNDERGAEATRNAGLYHNSQEVEEIE